MEKVLDKLYGDLLQHNHPEVNTISGDVTNNTNSLSGYVTLDTNQTINADKVISGILDVHTDGSASKIDGKIEPVYISEYTSTSAETIPNKEAFMIKHKTAGNMASGFRPKMVFAIEDDDRIINPFKDGTLREVPEPTLEEE